MNWRSLPPNLKIPFLFKLNNYSIDCLKLLLYLSFSLLVTPWYLVTSSEIIKLMIAFLLSQDLGTGSTWAWGQMPFAPTYGVFNFDWCKSCEYQKMSLILHSAGQNVVYQACDWKPCLIITMKFVNKNTYYRNYW